MACHGKSLKSLNMREVGVKTMVLAKSATKTLETCSCASLRYLSFKILFMIEDVISLLCKINKLVMTSVSHRVTAFLIVRRHRIHRSSLIHKELMDAERRGEVIQEKQFLKMRKFPCLIPDQVHALEKRNTKLA